MRGCMLKMYNLYLYDENGPLQTEETKEIRHNLENEKNCYYVFTVLLA